MPENFFPPLPPSDFPDDRRRQWLATEVGNTIKDHYGATFIVAASDSTNPESAHYQCDGTDDDVQLQTAFDALPAGGGEVIMLEGDYAIASDITLPAGVVRWTGKGAKMSCASGVTFTSNSHTLLIVDGIEFTRSGSSDTDTLLHAGGNGQAVFRSCYFHDLGANAVIGASNGGSNLLVTGCSFNSITLNENFDTAIVKMDVPGGGGDVVFVANYIEDITDNSGNRNFELVHEESGNHHGIIVGNVLRNVNGLSLGQDDVKASHNVVDGVMIPGDHDLDLADLSNVGTDTTTNRNALMADGDSWESRALVEADISDLDHDDADAIHDNVAGEIAALTQVTVASGDHILIEDASDSNNKKRVPASDLQGSTVSIEDGDVSQGSAATLDFGNGLDATVASNEAEISVNEGEIDHGSIGGLGDDDHTQYLLADGSRALAGEPGLDVSVDANGTPRDVYMFGDTVTYTASGSFDKADYPGLRAVRVRVVGGGGAGGGTAATSGTTKAAGAGGGSGAYAEVVVAASSLSTSETVTIGSGGTGSSGADGNAGSQSIFGAHATANGGGGGSVGPATTTFRIRSGGAGGTSGSGDLAVAGTSGGSGLVLDGDAVVGGDGGSSTFGGGAQGTGSGTDGAAGTSPGGGGAGATAGNSAAAKTGGAGGDGIVVVDLYF